MEMSVWITRSTQQCHALLTFSILKNPARVTSARLNSFLTTKMNRESSNKMGYNSINFHVFTFWFSENLSDFMHANSL